jgi:hypothetical protein
VGALGLLALLVRLRHRHRSEGRPHRRHARSRIGSGESRPAGSQGAARLDCQPFRRPADDAADPPQRRAATGELGRGDGHTQGRGHGADGCAGQIAKAVSTADDERPVNVFLGMAFQGERHLAEAFKQVAQQHMAEPDIHATCRLMASWSREQAEGLKPFIAAYHKDRSKDPDGSVKNLFDGPRSGGLGLLRDLHDLWLAANEVHLDYEAVKQAAKALHDQPLAETCERHLNQTDRQLPGCGPASTKRRRKRWWCRDRASVLF